VAVNMQQLETNSVRLCTADDMLLWMPAGAQERVRKMSGMDIHLIQKHGRDCWRRGTSHLYFLSQNLFYDLN